MKFKTGDTVIYNKNRWQIISWLCYEKQRYLYLLERENFQTVAKEEELTE